MKRGQQETLLFAGKAAADTCQCEFCKREISFEAPSHLVDLFVDGQIVLFVGSGVSSEGKGILPDTFYETISYATGNKTLDRAFPDVMEDYCARPEGRVGLITVIREHFDYIYSHREIYDSATRFHRQLATFFPLDTIITTNWDTYFEDECGAVAFVEDRDLPLWNVAKRRVLKIHGTIANLGSIVATRSDYKKVREI